ncbi:MAG: ATP-binding cassette domain-containing protein [Eubacteriales bacterium]|nr:ATP-binding cassette domain-containing protein [Eubacteriales bacterium]
MPKDQDKKQSRYSLLIIGDGLRAMGLAILVAFFAAALADFVYYYLAEVLGAFSEAALARDSLQLREHLFGLGLVLGLSAIVVPLTQAFANYLILKHSFPHENVLLAHFLKKTWLNKQRIKLSEVQARLEDDAIDFRLSLKNFILAVLEIPFIAFLLWRVLDMLPLEYIVLIFVLTLVNFFIANYRETRLAELEAESYVFRENRQSEITALATSSVNLRLTSRVEPRFKCWRGLFENWFADSGKQFLRLRVLKDSVTELSNYLLPLIILIFGALLVAKHEAKVGSVAAVLVLLPLLERFYQAIQKAVSEYRLLSELVPRLAFFYGDGEREGGVSVQVSEASPLLEISNLGYKLPDHEKYLIKDFNLQLEAGERVMLFGPNGSGKSTLLKIIAGLIEDYEGKIEIAGQNLTELDLLSWRNEFNFASQHAYFFPTSIDENIALGRQDIGDDLERLRNFVKLNEIQDLEQVNSSSGGEAQQLSLARALLRPQALLILDEPLNNLDSETVTVLLEILESYHGALLAVSHDPRLEAICHRQVKLQ